MKSMTRVLAVGSLSLALSMVAEAGKRREESLRSSKAGSVSLVCDVAQPATATIHRFWSVVNVAPQAAECWAAGEASVALKDRLPPGAPMRIALGMALGGLPTSTLPGRNPRDREHARNGSHLRANADQAFYDLSTQLSDRTGRPAFIEVNGSNIPKCEYYYIGKTKESIGGAGIGGDPDVDTIDHPFVQYYECYRWNGTNYVYDWTPLERRLDAALAVGPISSIVPGIPWAFQRGMTFVTVDDPRALRRISGASPAEYRGERYTEAMRETPYGNELVPDRLDDYGAFLEAAVRHLATSPKYQALVPQWKWKIGQEVDTRCYTRERYFELYKVSERAIRRVLPDARVGLHLGRVDTEEGWLPSFLRFCHQNELRCDFVGASRYYQLQQQDKSAPAAIEAWLKSIPGLPSWPAAAKLEIHEFGIDPAPPAADPDVQKTPFYAMLADRVMRTPAFGEWITVREASQPCLTWLESVAGWDLLECETRGTPGARDACIGAMVARAPGTATISALIYNYNPDAAEAVGETVRLDFAGMARLGNPKVDLQSFRGDHSVDQAYPSVESGQPLDLPGLLKPNSIMIVTMQSTP